MDFQPVIDLHISDVNPLNLQIIHDYWANSNGDFINSRTEILKIHNLTKKQLSDIIRESSHMTIEFGKCIDCGVGLVEKYVTQTSVEKMLKELRNRRSLYIRCKVHRNEYLSKRNNINVVKPRLIKNLDSLQEDISELDENDEVILASISENIKRGMLDKLTEEELTVLKEIIKCENKQAVYRNVFNGNPYDNEIWKIVKSIKEKNLLYEKRDINDKVIGFYVPDEIYPILEVKKPAYLSIYLEHNPYHNNDKVPIVSGEFILKKDVVLKRGMKYSYVGWKHKGNNIILKISDENEFNNYEYRFRANNEVKPIGEHIDFILGEINNDDFEPDPF